MIWVTPLGRDQLLLNDDQLLYIEPGGDTVLVLASGERLRVLESPEELLDRIARWRRQLMGLSLLDDASPS